MSATDKLPVTVALTAPNMCSSPIAEYLDLAHNSSGIDVAIQTS